MRTTAAVLALGATLLGAAGYGLLAGGDDGDIHQALSDGRTTPAPHLDLELLTAGDLGEAPRRWWRAARDGRVALSELRGSPAVVSFWAAPCAPCNEDSRQLQRAIRDTGSEVLVLGVGRTDSAATARDFVHGLGLSYPQVHDASGETARRWDVTAVPETFFITPEGDIVGHIVGAATPDDMRRGIAAAVSGRAAGLQTGGPHRPIP